ncbi:GDSL-type esterase/lipase family protein [Thalassobellus suaedae]|uniref:GDSL-type esterase/lipase family protein n=1 Tax=Thalassobellus suaedae TaxID=3074124 RepID=A0ABY9XZP2_9FLAO|nr:GDSL-type esterase/lipase family protein [Flavobacteriaceae bacterium HL-DH10]
MNIHFIPILILSLLFNFNETMPKKYRADNKNFHYNGRYELIENGAALTSPGANVSINFSGDYCEVYLKAERVPYNYVAFELDGEYLGRKKISGDNIASYIIEVTSKEKRHTLKIIKESEASNGFVLFNSIKVEEVLSSNKKPKHFIEFIGDSITCGAVADDSVTPCGEGEYFDHENVYFSYGADVARALDSDFMLSSVSGIGMYRNWNDENIEEPIMPQVYENLYLDTNNSKKYNFEKKPDLVSICLGTNDLSNGDGIKPRLPFNEETYVTNYINFVKKVYSHYPNTQIVLLNSPMVVGENNTLLVSCLKDVQSYFAENHEKSILLFEFDKAYVNGCSWHPSVEEHKQIAEKLTPFFKNILHNK